MTNMELLEIVNKLIKLGKGERGRLEYIKEMLENNRKLYNSDLKYVENLKSRYLHNDTPGDKVDDDETSDKVDDDETSDKVDDDETSDKVDDDETSDKVDDDETSDKVDDDETSDKVSEPASGIKKSDPRQKKSGSTRRIELVLFLILVVFLSFYHLGSWNESNGKNSRYMAEQKLAEEKAEMDRIVEEKGLEEIAKSNTNTEWVIDNFHFKLLGLIKAHGDNISADDCEYGLCDYVEKDQYILVISAENLSKEQLRTPKFCLKHVELTTDKYFTWKPLLRHWSCLDDNMFDPLEKRTVHFLSFNIGNDETPVTLLFDAPCVKMFSPCDDDHTYESHSTHPQIIATMSFEEYNDEVYDWKDLKLR